MNLGIAGKTGLLCASSQGLGHACAVALVREDVNIVINGRDKQKLVSAAESLSDLGSGHVGYLVADITTSAGRAALLKVCPSWDIITHNMGKYEDSPNALSTEMEQVDVEHRNSFFAIDVANTDICMHV
jgi:3-oxoacyl-[acyl-carrier protein] reductase